MKSKFVFFIALLGSTSLAAQVWRLEGVTENNRSRVEQAIRTLDAVSDVVVDSKSKTLNIYPRPKAKITDEQILAALKLIPDVILKEKISNIPPPIKRNPPEEKIDFPPDKIQNPKHKK
ncbi:MAG: hypothetical protein JWQ35_2130 [Bacteriovoracaceae bacterium]|nr:hypothetical protein [Bacteriovoracaceae bacterium]